MANEISVGQLRSIIDQIVEQALGEKLEKRLSSWSADRSSVYTRPSYDQSKTNKYGSGFDFGRLGNSLTSIGNTLSYGSALEKTGKNPELGQTLSKIGQGISSAFGIYDAYRNNDPVAGALAGFQLAGPIGAGIGFLAGLFGKKKEIDEWNKPKFQDAEKAYNKLFTVDRGEVDLYYMPESFYFRSGWSGPRHIVVKVGNDQFDNHIRESMTSSYATQLQRGLVF